MSENKVVKANNALQTEPMLSITTVIGSIPLLLLIEVKVCHYL